MIKHVQGNKEILNETLILAKNNYTYIIQII